MNPEVIHLLAQGFTLITPTRRLSRYLQGHYAARQIEQGNRAWMTPDCLPWTAWCQRQFQEPGLQQHPPGLLLTEYQQQWLWQQIVQTSPTATQLLQTASTSRQALHSYEICKSWDIPIFPQAVYLNEDAFAFQSWGREYEDLLSRNDWLDTAGLPDYLSKRLAAGANTAGKIALYGFDAITPQQKRLLEALKKSGSTVLEIAPWQRNRSVSCLAFSDSRAEIHAAANWARQVCTDYPNASTGIITPRLKTLRQDIIRGFDAVLTPESLIKPHDTIDRPFNLSLGRPLSSYPVIHAALVILALGKRKQSLNALSTVLRSPFIQGADAESAKRSLFDALLRKMGGPEPGLGTVFRIAEKQCKAHEKCDDLLRQLKGFDSLFSDCPRHQTTRDWAKTFGSLLKNFAWPGERTLSSEEYQTISAWNDAVKQFAALERVAKPLNYQAALACLVKIVTDTGFQPETSEAPIQILGTTGAAGMQFDHLWVMGLHDQAWPAAAQPDPFIPLCLQREKGLPDASAEHQLAWTKKITEGLLHSSTEVVFSYPEQDGDRTLRPSPLIKQVAGNPSEPRITLQADYKKQIFHSGKLESFSDDTAPVIAHDQPVRGGTAIFKDQAACPFRGFARHRLFAEGLRTAEIGLSPAERGLLTHKALEYLWQRLQTSGDLLQLLQQSGPGREKIIDSVVTQAIGYQARQQPEAFAGRFTQLEQQRLVRLINEWLLIERERAPFRVRETEQWHTVMFHELEIHIRIDRIDELADGRLVILDYKTGKVSVNDWEGERPDDPQLPLYAVTGGGAFDKAIAVIAFAGVKHGESGFAGLAESDDLLPGVHTDPDQTWSDRFSGWETVLRQLAREFREGKANVAPKDQKACRYCDLHCFCRIYEKTGVLAQDASGTIETI